MKVTLQGIQTLAFPEGASMGLRWEEKIIMNKTVEIMDDGSSSSHAGSSSHAATASGSHSKSAKSKGKEKQKDSHHHPHHNGVTPSAPLVGNMGALSLGTQTPPLPHAPSASALPVGEADRGRSLAPAPIAAAASSLPSSATPSPAVGNIGLPGIDDAHEPTANGNAASGAGTIGNGKSVRATAPDVPIPYTSTRKEGMHLEKGVHG